MASALLLFVISAAYFVWVCMLLWLYIVKNLTWHCNFREILLVRNLILDWFSYGFFIWNFGCMGLMVIHWKGPLRLQQAYLILTSALVVSFTVPPPHLALTTLTIYIANKRVCSLMYVCMYKEWTLDPPISNVPIILNYPAEVIRWLSEVYSEWLDCIMLVSIRTCIYHPTLRM